jgi:hypothetical protein
LPNRVAVTQAPDIAPQRDAGAIGKNFIKLGRDIGVRDIRGDPQCQLWTAEKRSFFRDRIAMINKPVFTDAKRAALVESGCLFIVHVIHFFATMSI